MRYSTRFGPDPNEAKPPLRNEILRFFSRRLASWTALAVVSIACFSMLWFFGIETNRWARIRTGAFTARLVWPQFQLWRCLTSVFIHSRFSRLCWNLTTFAIYGTPVNILLSNQRFMFLSVLSAFVSAAVSVAAAFTFQTDRQMQDAGGLSGLTAAYLAFVMFAPFSFRPEETVVLANRSKLWFNLYIQRRIVALICMVHVVMEAFLNNPDPSLHTLKTSVVGGFLAGVVGVSLFDKLGRNRLFAVDTLYDFGGMETPPASSFVPAGSEYGNGPQQKHVLLQAIDWCWREETTQTMREDAPLVTRKSIIGGMMPVLIFFVVPIAFAVYAGKPWTYSPRLCMRQHRLETMKPSELVWSWSVPLYAYHHVYRSPPQVRATSSKGPTNELLKAFVSDVFYVGHPWSDPFRTRFAIVDSEIVASVLSGCVQSEGHGASNEEAHRNGVAACLLQRQLTMIFWTDMEFAMKQFDRFVEPLIHTDELQTAWYATTTSTERVLMSVAWLDERWIAWGVTEVNHHVSDTIVKDLLAMLQSVRLEGAVDQMAKWGSSCYS